jgi:SAM-dependent methyltransferase
MSILARIIAPHFRRPSGLLGHAAARVMRKNNQSQYHHVVQLLQAEDKDEILEIGCGEGNAIRLIVEQNSLCKVDGIDFSRFMLKKAGRNNRAAIQEKRVRLFPGDIKDYDFGMNTYSKIFAINVVYFWTDLEKIFRKIHELLKPKGKVVLFMASPQRLDQVPHALPGIFNKYSLDQVQSALRQSGFSDMTCETVVKYGTDTYFLSATRN